MNGKHETTVDVEKACSSRSILGVNVVASSYEETVCNCLLWARERQSKSILFANVHVIMEAFDDAQFRQKLNMADMVNPDGVPLVWMLRAQGEKNAHRVYGPDAALAMFAAAEDADLSVGFYGGTQRVLDALLNNVRKQHPQLRVGFCESPPFRKLTAEEDADAVGRIKSSGIHVLFVGLGCPKQEVWIANHLGTVPAVMFGVGAAFDFIAGTKPQAPRWIMRGGLEWAFRLLTEPRRLTKRYFKHNPRFVYYAISQLLKDHQH